MAAAASTFVRRRCGCRCFSSALSSAIRGLRHEVLAASLPDALPRTPAVSSSTGDWSAVRGQAASVAAWPAHPLEPPERLALAEALASRLPEEGLPASRRAEATCALYRSLLEPEQIFAARSEGTARCAVVTAADEGALTAATAECAGLLLRGFAVSLATPPGATLDLAQKLLAPFPASLLQATEAGALAELPRVVHSLRNVGGPSASTLWAMQEPPADFGGWQASSDQEEAGHGMAASMDCLALARTDVEALSRLPKSKYELSEEASDLTALLSTALAAEVPTAPGLPPPRWSRSAYDRGLEEVNDLLDLLWAFSETASSEALPVIVPSRKHFLLTVGGSTEVPEEIVKAAVVSSLGPFREPVTLHAIGLGARGLSKDPLRGFCRLVESGRSGLEWQLKEHESWSSFLAWLASEDLDMPSLFGTLRGHEHDLRRLCAAAGGVAWGQLFAAEPLEQLRRWASPVSASATPWHRSDIASPVVEVTRPLPPES